MRILSAAALLLIALAAPAPAQTALGMPLVRQPFVKFCPDGSIVGSLGPNLRGEPAGIFGAFAYDGGTGRTEFLRRSPDFVARLAANPCVQRRTDREPRG